MLDVKLNVLDVKSLPVMKVAIVEVSKSDKSRGNVELKVYKPSVKKNKGASLEMRKLSGYDFEHVRVLRETIEHYLDDYINEDNAKLVDMKVQDTIFRCVKCDWISKSEPALKSHITRIHDEKKLSCKTQKGRKRKKNESASKKIIKKAVMTSHNRFM